MIKYLLVFLSAGVLAYYSLSCKDISRGEQLAISYCGACHLMPKPELLDKNTWENGVLPEMAVWMGVKPIENTSKFSMEDIYKIRTSGVLPPQAMLSESDFNAIVDYYVKNAPEKLTLTAATKYHSLDSVFAVKKFPFVDRQELTLLKYLPSTKNLFLGTRQGYLWNFDPKTSKADSTNYGSPPTDIEIQKDDTYGLLISGKLEPNNLDNGTCFLGKIQNKKLKQGSSIQKLQRPVNLAFGDLNQDKREDVVIASFGSFAGKLAWYDLPPNAPPVEHIIKQVAGATNILLKDLNNDQRLDIVALFGQGNEGVFIFYNQGNGNFSEEQVLRFPPVYGSLHIELEDFNKDGFLDILYTNGDNGDYSQIFKPYHGIRIFLNDGKNHFKEKYFFPMYGAIKSIAKDFDGDGDLDIASISFFPDYDISPQKSFVFLRNDGNFKFTPFTSAKTDTGRWMVMDSFDYDQDGDVDILIGSCYDAVRLKKTGKPSTSVLLIENKMK